jgi:hypothetical protein
MPQPGHLGPGAGRAFVKAPSLLVMQAMLGMHLVARVAASKQHWNRSSPLQRATLDITTFWDHVNEAAFQLLHWPRSSALQHCSFNIG